jgi:methylase of polypeptide subunit release factors
MEEMKNKGSMTTKQVLYIKAVELAQRMGLQGVTHEIVQALTHDGECWAIYGQILNAIKMELSKQSVWFFQHVSRVANSVAHYLAQLAFVYGEGREWSSNFPFSVDKVAPISV